MLVPVVVALAMLMPAAPKTPEAPTASRPAVQGCTAACCGTLSGAVSAKFECSVEAPYDDKRVLMVISPEGQVPGVKSILPAKLEIALPFEGRSFTLASLGAGESRVTLADGSEYLAAGAKGELTLEVDGLERYSAPRRRFRVAGTLRARLVATTPNAPGEVHLEVRF